MSGVCDMLSFLTNKWNEITRVSLVRQLYFLQQAPDEWTDPGFVSDLLRSVVVLCGLPRTLYSGCDRNFSLDHPFAVVSSPNHLILDHDFVALRVDTVDIGIVGQVILLQNGFYQYRLLLETEFLLKVEFIDPRVKTHSLSDPRLNAMVFVYGGIPILSTYIF